MGRTKSKVQPFDFSDYSVPDTEKLVRAKYQTEADLITRLEFIDANKAHDDYYMKRNIQLLKNGTTYVNLNKWMKRHIIDIIWKYEDTLQQQETVKFRAWFDSREDAQQTWKECFSSLYGLHSYTHYYNNGTYSPESTREEWAALLDKGPVDPHMWAGFLANYSVKDYVELHRNPKYEIGDLVLLRKAYVGNWRYDPEHETDIATPRFGTIMGYKEKTGGTRRSSSGKGSRTVSVLWAGKQDIVDVMEKTIKLESRKGHKMGKV